jgi:hypothetical protein
VTTGPYTWACAVSHGATTILMELIIEAAQPVACAKGSLPIVGVHAEILEIGHVDHEFTVLTSQTIVSAQKRPSK